MRTPTCCDCDMRHGGPCTVITDNWEMDATEFICESCCAIVAVVIEPKQPAMIEVERASKRFVPAASVDT